MRINSIFFGPNTLVFGVMIAAIVLALPLAGWAASDSECQAYSRIALMQVAIAKGKQNGGIGDGCAGAEGPRWTDNKAEHFNWCLEADPEFVADEQKARRDLLLDCTARRGNREWYGWDADSCGTYSGGLSCMSSPDPEGQGKCERQGGIILNAVKAVQNDGSILFDEAKDKYFYNSNYYHHFQHWKNFRCVLKKSAAGLNAYFLEGYTGVGIEAEGPEPDSPVIKEQPPGGGLFEPKLKHRDTIRKAP